MARSRWRIVAVLALVASSTSAQPAPASGLDATIAEALALRVQGRDAEALALLTRAWDSTRSARARAQMARAEQAVGRWLDAEQHMTEALASADPWIVARRASLEEERERVREHLGRVELLGLPDGARARVDARGPYVLPLAEPPWSTVGTVLVEVEADGSFPVTRQVVVDAGRVTRETITLVPVPPAPSTPVSVTTAVVVPVSAPPPARIEVAPPGSARAALGVGGMITGAVFGAGGLAAQLTHEALVSSAASHGCGIDPMGRLAGPSDCADRASSIDVATALAWTGYLAGAVFAGAGLVLYLTAPRASARSRAAVACAPWMSGLSCTLRF